MEYPVGDYNLDGSYMIANSKGVRSKVEPLAISINEDHTATMLYHITDAITYKMYEKIVGAKVIFNRQRGNYEVTASIQGNKLRIPLEL